MTAPGGTLKDRPADGRVGVLVVDDQLLFREAAREVIAATPGFELVGEAVSGEQALRAADELCPDLILLDVRMPGMGGVEAAARLHKAHPDQLVVLISTEQPDVVERRVKTHDAAAIVPKHCFGAALLRSLWRMYGSAPG
ncbi:MAG TPA: response regulator transcription factor [Thermoleophilaceae bacterium]